MKDLLFGILGFAVVIGIIVAITNKFSKKLYNIKEVEILKMEDVIRFLKKKCIVIDDALKVVLLINHKHGMYLVLVHDALNL